MEGCLGFLIEYMKFLLVWIIGFMDLNEKIFIEIKYFNFDNFCYEEMEEFEGINF